jgi:DNA-binding NarL/FixJ family response regulator
MERPVTVRVVIVDDHDVVRQGMRNILGVFDDIEVVGDFPSGMQALGSEVIGNTDVVLMDIAMKRMNGLETTTRLLESAPNLKVIIFSAHATAEFAAQALLSGASGYVVKSSAATDVAKAIRTVVGGDQYIDARISRLALENHLRQLQPGQKPQSILTNRQREVLQLLAEGHGTKEIAAALSISAKTVETHRAQIMQRLDIHDVPGLVRYAIRAGVISTED